MCKGSGNGNSASHARRESLHDGCVDLMLQRPKKSRKGGREADSSCDATIGKGLESRILVSEWLLQAAEERQLRTSVVKEKGAVEGRQERLKREGEKAGCQRIKRELIDRIGARRKGQCNVQDGS